MKAIQLCTVTFLVLCSTFSAARAADIEEFTVNSVDVNSVKVVFHKKYPTSLEITLKQNKAKELSAFTNRNIGNKVRIIIEGNVVTEPIVREGVTGQILEVAPKDTDEAIRLAKLLMGK